MTNTLHIKNELSQLAILYDFLKRFAGSCGLNEPQQMEIKLAIEEVVTNIILYAYPDTQEEDIRIDLSYDKGKLEIILTDNGIAFNPLEREEPDLTLSLDDRPIGGLGIYLAKQLMTVVRYNRSAGKNILIMIKEYN